MSTGDCVAVSIASISTALTIILFIIEKHDKRVINQAHDELDAKFRGEYLKKQERVNDSLIDISQNLLIVAWQLKENEEGSRAEALSNPSATDLSVDQGSDFRAEVLESIKEFIDFKISQENN